MLCLGYSKYFKSLYVMYCMKKKLYEKHANELYTFKIIINIRAQLFLLDIQYMYIKNKSIS